MNTLCGAFATVMALTLTFCILYAIARHWKHRRRTTYRPTIDERRWQHGFKLSEKTGRN